MASSLSPECTPLKHEYDNCFNSWFEGYLEPVVGSKGQPPTDVERERHAKAKAEEYESNCGKLWTSYKECLNKAVVGSGLDKLLDDAREQNPLTEQPPSTEGSKTS
ncbi:hypothetical protein DL93DRAFT_2159797 [Clavulina sp. PMI_390]|nr:hypothetical protein DL93DRAFT_2159797 [Clavulina sp. PMI_390]